MATPISDVSICNSALIKVGAERINTLDDDEKRAKVCKEQYGKIKEELLRGHLWNFAVGRQNLALSATYVPAFEFESAFPYPSNVLKIIKLDINLGTTLTEEPWKVEIDPTDYKKYIVCNSGALAIEAIYNVPESRFAADFAEALALKLAADIAYALTNSTTLVQQLTVRANLALALARSMDAQEASVPKTQDGQYLYARLSGGPGFRND